MFRLIVAIAMVMMPVVSTVSQGDHQDPIQSRDVFKNEGCDANGNCGGGGGGGNGTTPFTDGGSWTRGGDNS